MIPVKEVPTQPIKESPALKIDREFVKDILSISAETKANVFRATSYPMPDGSYRDLVFCSFVIWRPEVLALTKDPKGDTSEGKFYPLVQWLARVLDKETRAHDVVSLHVQNGKVTGRASFCGQYYEQKFGDGEPPASVKYTLLGEAVPYADKLEVSGGPPRVPRFFHRDTLIADLAVEVDFSLTQEFGSVILATDAMLAMIADLNTIYFRDLEVVFNLTFLGIMNIGPSPYEIRTLLGNQEIQATAKESFEDYWKTNYGHVQRDLVVLVSNNLVISAQTGVANGLSKIGTLCDKDDAYVLFTYASDPATLVYRAAHEIGHCFGAIHTNCTPDPASPIGFVDGCSVASSPPGQPPPPCFSGPNPVYPNVPGTIMSLCPNIGLRFHPLSAEMIETELVSKTCLEPASLKLLQNGVPEINLGSQFGNSLYFAIDVPEYVVDFIIETTGGSGDVDLYAQRRTLNVFASWPSTNPGNNEQLLFQRPVRSGRWYIRLEPAPATGSFSNVQLIAAYRDAVVLQNNVPHSELLFRDAVLFFKLDVPLGARSVTLTAIHPSGQFEFFVGRNARPDVQNVMAPENLYHDGDTNNTMKTYGTVQGQPTVGLWYMGIRALPGLQNLQNLTVTITYQM
jgi:hypothetical protein